MRRVLYVAHGFPPAGGSGPNRALAMCRYLPAEGWQPTVLTAAAEWAAPRDDSLMAELPAGLKVIRTRSFEARPEPPVSTDPAATAGSEVAPRAARATWLRAQFGHARRFPDAHLGWFPFALSAGLGAVRRQRVDAVFSTAGPFTSHVVALALHWLTGIPWVAELRDGWYEWNRAIFPDYPAWRGALERRLEARVVRASAAVILTTDLMAEAFRHQYAGCVPGDHFIAIPNGFDPTQYQHQPSPPPVAREFQVVHAGAVYYGRSIEAFLDSAGRLAARDPRFREQFRLVLVGSLDETARAEVQRQVRQHGLTANVEVRGYLDHAATLAELGSASLLLLLVNTTPGAERTVPGKLYEYLAVRRPILAITPPGAEAAEIVRRTEAGWVAPAHDVDGIGEQLWHAFAAHLAGAPFRPRLDQVHRYDRRQQARDLARVLGAASLTPVPRG